MLSFEVIRVVNRRVVTEVVRADDARFDKWHPDIRNQVAMQEFRAIQEDALTSDVPTVTRLVTCWDGSAASGARHINRAWRDMHGMI
jgi:hypothetical protein